LVFRLLSPVPVTFVDVNAVKQNKSVNVTWKVENEINISSYVVEKSSDGRNFAAIGSVSATGVSLYSLLDNQPFNGTNFYRVRSVGNSGDIRYSRVVKVVFDIKPEITMYPNPVGSNGIIHLSFKDIAKGLYFVKIIDLLGQTIAVQTIDHDGLNLDYLIPLSNKIAHGNYKIELTNSENQKRVLEFLY
jgi:hypothetical protein